MKYHPSEQMLNELSGGMAKLYAELFSNESFDLIIPIPATTSSLRSRLFHVTEFLAKKIKQKNGLKTKIESRALRFKNSKRTPQASLTRRQRLINAKNCFEANKELVEGKNILLIEDVITTGATVNSALQELFKKNAKSVSIYCLAKSKERRLISFS